MCTWSGFAHEIAERFHGLFHGAVIDAGADIEIEIFKSLGAHPRRLRHRAVRPAEHDPACLGHAHVLVHRRPPVPLVHRHLLLGHVAHLGDVVAAANADVALAGFHTLAFDLADELHLLVAGGAIQCALHLLLIRAHQRYSPGGRDGFNQ